LAEVASPQAEVAGVSHASPLAGRPFRLKIRCALLSVDHRQSIFGFSLCGEDNERTRPVTRPLPDLRGVNVVEAKARLTALNINTVISGRSDVPTALRMVVREQLPSPGTAFADDGEYHVLLLTTKGPPHG
jgi:hypothetical protein